jgi:hypothetical protein
MIHRWRRPQRDVGGVMVAALLVLAACSGESSSETTPATCESTVGATTVASTTDPVANLVPAPSPSSNAFPVSVATDQRSLLDADGRPWLMVGDAGWSSLVMLDAPAQDEYFDGLAAHHFNTVLVNVIENTYSDHPPFDASGRPPFVGEMYRSAPDEAYWAGFDRYVAAAAERGITLLAAPTYVGSSDDGELENIAAASVEEMAGFGSFLGERYGAAPNIIWVIGGDRTELSDELFQRLDAFAGGIRATSSQLMTAHTNAFVTAADVFGCFGWLQLNTVYNTAGSPVPATLTAIEQTPTRPTFSMEGIYEQEREDPQPPGNMLLRYQAYGAVLSGAFGHVFGNNPRWHFGSTATLYPYEGTWQQSLDDDGGPLDLGTRHMAVFAEVIGDIPWWTLRPDGGMLVTDGRGSNHRQAAAAMDTGTGWAAVYTVSTDRIMLDLSVLAGAGAEVVVRRLDPASGAVTDLGVMTTSAAAELSYPGENSNGDDDWLYLLSPSSLD